MWLYESPIGPIYIKYFKNQNQFGIIYDNTIWEYADDPEALASNVYCHCIGCDEWDSIDGEVDDVPIDFGEWGKV